MIVASTMILPIFFLFCSTFLTALSQTPEFIKPCRKSDPEINACATDSLDHLRKYILSGIPDLELPPLDPLRIPKLQLENGAGRIRVKAVLSDLIIYGAANHTITNIRADAKAYTLQITAKAPRIAVTGKYEVIGNVLVLNIRSKGDFQAVFGPRKTINGVKYMQVDKIGIDFKLGRARFRIRDRSSNNKVLSEAINNFLNQNWREVIEEMKYPVSTTIGNYVKENYKRCPVENSHEPVAHRRITITRRLSVALKVIVEAVNIILSPSFVLPCSSPIPPRQAVN